MGYEVRNNGSFCTVVKNSKLQMKVYPTKKGPLPKSFNFMRSGADVNYTMALAAEAVCYVRSQLPLGPFNNVLKIGSQRKYLTNNISPRWLAARAETMYTALAFHDDQPRDTITQLAARSLATRTVGGGVCSMMATVTAGYLTTKAKKGTVILIVFDARWNHEFVVLFYGRSQYVVADPWVGSPYVCFWNETCFPPPRSSSCIYTQIEIKEPLEVPYGVVFSEQQVQMAIKTAEIHRLKNPPSNQMLTVPLEKVLDNYKKYSWFHMDKYFFQEDNLAIFAKAKYQRAAGPEDWGGGKMALPVGNSLARNECLESEFLRSKYIPHEFLKSKGV